MSARGFRERPGNLSIAPEICYSNPMLKNAALLMTIAGVGAILLFVTW